MHSPRGLISKYCSDWKPNARTSDMANGAFKMRDGEDEAELAMLPVYRAGMGGDSRLRQNIPETETIPSC